MKKFLLLAFIFLLMMPAVVSAQTLTQKQQDAIDYVLENDVMYPNLDGEFSPDMVVSRLEFTLAAVDVLAHDADFEHCYRNIAPSQPPSFTLLFNDVGADEWYGKQLCMAIYEGMVAGDRDGNFRPYDTVTVAEASKILSRGYGLIYPAARPTGKAWYEAPMLSLEMKGAISSRMKPEAALTRVDMAVMFHALRGQQRYPLSRIIGFKMKGAAVAAASDTAIVENTAPVAIAPLQTSRVINATPCSCLPPAIAPTNDGGISVQMKGAKAWNGVSRPSHRILRKRVLDGRWRIAEPLAP